MKFAFCTCVQIGLSCMEAIYRIGGTLELIVTLHDQKATKKSGRILVDDFAAKHNIPILKISSINEQCVIDTLKKFEIDWFFIIGWSQIASKQVIESPKLGTIGAHPTLLPQGRGRAAIPWAILKGLTYTGVTLFKLDTGIDTGNIIDQEIVPIDSKETATSLYHKINNAHEALIQQAYPKLIKNTIKEIPQDEKLATYWGKRSPEDGEIMSNMLVNEVDLLVRATTKPYPGAFIKKDGNKIIIWKGEIGVVPNAHILLEFTDGKYSVLESDSA